MSSEVIGLKGVKIPDLQETTEVRDSNYMILVDEETGRTYKVKREHIKAQKTSELVDDVGFLRAIPGEYMTKSEVKELTDTEIAQIDGEIAQIKELTDAEIAQIREVLNTWEAFKNTGGEIGGDISTTKVKSPMLVNESEYTVGMWNKGFGVESTDKYGSWAFVGTNNQHLGHPNSPWADLHLSGVSKSANGYTKLPNGMILQWGTFASNESTIDVTEHRINFPISFNEKTINVITSIAHTASPHVQGCSSNGYDRRGFTIYKYRTNSGACTVNWIAIGY